MESIPMVSICSTTYNLEKYIAEAIESWLAQKTNFDFEIVICDDYSKDNTIKIVESYIEKYPTKIRLFKAEQNMGMMPNFIRSLKAARGKYIAVCDGDDYWIDNNKLQLQVDFLETSVDFSACLTNSYVIDEDTGEKKIAKTLVWCEAASDKLLLHDDFLDKPIKLSPGHISTYVFRNNLIKNYPDWFYDDDVVTDFPLFMMISKYGKTKFINHFTSVYRKRIGSHSWSWYSRIKIQRSRIKMYKCVNRFLDYKYKKQINKLISKHYFNIFKFYSSQKKYIRGCEAFINSIYFSPTNILMKLKNKKFSKL